MGGLWKVYMLQERKEWAKKRNPRLDKKMGPLEVVPGITWRSVFKYNFFLMGLAGLIAFANERAYQKVRQDRGYSGSTLKATRETKQMLKEGADEAIELTPREKLEAAHKKISDETDNWNHRRIKNVAIPRPEEGLTVDNLRETAMGSAPLKDTITESQLQKIRERAA
eukprot:TRINITY_DN29018_c0_g1_i1.p1 TRINITY_DN29018_c0_g1~~TRINITY_DN29018_c0_g1_i1.p1  ORF type:complete len:179 (+),score=70.17 TRINITY_DN29018_c0_g1_i1:34-537(+)